MKRGRKPKCPFCGASHNIAKGKRLTVTLGPRPLRVCKNCGRKFTVGRTVPIEMQLASIQSKLESIPSPQPQLVEPPDAATVESSDLLERPSI